MSLEALVKHHLESFLPAANRGAVIPILIKQVRDLLLCSYSGEVQLLEAHFLRPAAQFLASFQPVSIQPPRH